MIFKDKKIALPTVREGSTERGLGGWVSAGRYGRHCLPVYIVFGSDFKISAPNTITIHIVQLG